MRKWIVAGLLLSCGGVGPVDPGPGPYTGNYLQTCFLSITCRPSGVDPYFLTKPGGSYCASSAVATTQANALCAASTTSSCRSCSAQCTTGARCQ